MRLRKGDLDHIVDELSDGEGDEEAGRKARLEQQIQDEKDSLKQVITVVTEGRDAARKNRQKGKYSFEKLVQDGVDGTVIDGGVQEEEMDEEEMIQKKLQMKVDLEKQNRSRQFNDLDSDSEEESSDIDEENLREILGNCQLLFLPF